MAPFPMRILHIISQRPDSTGSGYYLQNILRLTSLAGHQNYLVAGAPAGGFPRIDWLGGESIRFVSFAGGDLDFALPGMSDVMPYESSAFGDLADDDLAAYEKAFAVAIAQAAQTFRPDVIHSHHLWIVTAIARRVLPDIPIVTSCHSTDLRQFMKCAHLRSRVLADCRKVERVLALGREQVGRIRALYGIPEDRIDLVGGGYDQDLFYWHTKGTPPPVHLLYAGKLSFAKGVDWLLRTCRSLSHLPIHLHLAGSGAGDEAGKCLDLAGQTGIQVTLHGPMRQQELASLMRSCHVFILPSFYEGLPLVLIEALASGCRIVTTDLAGCRELLGQGSADLVELIALPALQTVDQPYMEDMERLEARLAQAVVRMVDRVMRAPSPDCAEIAGLTAAFGWKSVFKRVLQSYARAMAAEA